jgi:crotonobetainyl-CoA:carnitine CoA-transferase CaiB-like acyl-CoA transferase
MGNQHPSIAPYELLPTADGDLVLAVGTDGQFAALCSVAGLAPDERFATNASRVEHRAALRAALVEALAAAPASAWAARLAEVGVPAGQVNDVGAAFALASSLGLDPIVEVPGADGATVALVRNPVRMSVTPPRHDSAPPALGELSIDDLTS